MGRKVRKVPRDWQHPYNERGDYEPLRELSEPVEAKQRRWDDEAALWNEGKHPGQIEDPKLLGSPFADWDGDRPDAADYMPFWLPSEATHFQMYQTTSEGTPISPVMESLEELARWLADTGASWFGDTTATYDVWIRVCMRAQPSTEQLDALLASTPSPTATTIPSP